MRLIRRNHIDHWAAMAGQLWDMVLEAHDVDDVASRDAVWLACEQLDRAEALAREIKKDGCVLRSKTSSMVRDHPAIKHELACRAFVCKQLRELGLTRADVRRGSGRPTMSEALYAD